MIIYNNKNETINEFLKKCIQLNIPYKNEGDKNNLVVLSRAKNFFTENNTSITNPWNFDDKCFTKEFIWQKLNYIHQNPVRGKWMLVANAIDYLHSSAKYYYTQMQGIYPMLNFFELNDMAWTIGNAGI